jgi:uncharacterized protein (DUF2141 family)
MSYLNADCPVEGMVDMKAKQRKQIAALVILLALALGLSNAAQAKTSKVTVKAIGFESDEGEALFAVVNSPEAYEDIGKNALAATRNKIKNKQSQSDFYLPPGWYAVSVVHDQNNNAKLDKNFLGIPNEPYGFSNNPSSLGKPSFEGVKFKVDSSPRAIEIKLN